MDSQPEPAATINVMIDADEHVSSTAMRHRPVPHQYAHPNEQFPPAQPMPAGGLRVPLEYTNDKYRRNRHDTRSYYERLRSYLAPTDDDRVRAQMDYETVRASVGRPQSLCARVRNLACAVASMLTAAVIVFILWDLAASEGNVQNMRTINLLWTRDHMRVVPKFIMPETGAVVYNVLNPTRAVDNIREVEAMMNKIRRISNGRVFRVLPIELQQGYAEYMYVSAVDLDADAVRVNFTFAQLALVMKPPWNSELVCEGALHYGIERDIIAVYNWSSSNNDADDPKLLYNAQVVETCAQQIPSSLLVREQTHCRIADIIMAGITEQQTTQNNSDAEVIMVPASGTVEYMTDSGRKRRKIITQPLLHCIQHVLKLGGVKS